MPPTGRASTRAPPRPVKSCERAQRDGVGVEVVARRVADEDAGRPRGRRREALGAAEPVGGPAGREGPGRAVGAVAVGDVAQRREEDLLDGALDGPQRERRLHGGVGALDVEGGQGAAEDRRVLADGLAGAGHGRGDREPLLERVAQGEDVAVRVEPVLARRPLRLRVREAPLPGTERVGADVQRGSRLGCLQGAHRRAGVDHSSTPSGRSLAGFAQLLLQSLCKSSRKRLRCGALTEPLRRPGQPIPRTARMYVSGR